MPLFKELDYCNFEEFEAGRPSRRDPSTLHFDDMYVLMLAFQTTQPEVRAARTHIELTDIPFRKDAGIWVVRFAVLNNRLDPHSQHEALFVDRQLSGTDPVLMSPDQHMVQTGYIRSYADILDDHLSQLTAGAEVALPLAA